MTTNKFQENDLENFALSSNMSKKELANIIVHKTDLKQYPKDFRELNSLLQPGKEDMHNAEEKIYINKFFLWLNAHNSSFFLAKNRMIENGLSKIDINIIKWLHGETSMARTLNKKGRPQKYTPELAKEICEVILTTSKGTKKLCEEHPHWPCQDAFFSWLKTYSEFSEQYARAKICQVEFLVDEMLEIADDASGDSFLNEEGRTIVNGAAINRAKLKIDTRKWLACKLVPRVYGPKPPEESFVDL
jgi:hypothetical protein